MRLKTWLIDLEINQRSHLTSLKILLFEEHANRRRQDFVNAVEEVASLYSGGGAFWGGQGIGKQWRMRREMRTPRYTTCWEELPLVGLTSSTHTKSNRYF